MHLNEFDDDLQSLREVVSAFREAGNPTSGWGYVDALRKFNGAIYFQSPGPQPSALTRNHLGARLMQLYGEVSRLDSVAPPEATDAASEITTARRAAYIALNIAIKTVVDQCALVAAELEAAAAARDPTLQRSGVSRATSSSHVAMAESSNNDTVLERARALFAAEGLPFPPLPENLAARLRQRGESVFTTIDHQYSPYAIHHYAEPLRLGGDSGDYAVIGFDGHGVNSYAVHCYLVEGNLALFIQRPWGGVYMDPETLRPLIERAFKLVAQLREKMALAHRMGLVLPGRRLIAVLSMSDTYCGWGWSPARHESIVWHETEQALEGALQAVTDLIDGQSH